MEDDFARGSKNFLQWFKAQPGTTFHPDLELADLRANDAGRGLVALKDISAGHNLFTIPRSLLLDTSNSRLNERLPTLFEVRSQQNLGIVQDDASVHGDRIDNFEVGLSEEEPDIPDSWLNLILVVIYEYLQGEDSRWAAYLDILPASVDRFNTLMFWSKSELAELQASAIVDRIGQASANAMLKTYVVDIIQEHADIFYPSVTTRKRYSSSDDLLRLAHSVGSLIMAYAFDLETEPDPSDEEDEDENADGWKEDRDQPSKMAMVPMADMLNADAEFNAHLSHGDEELTMTSIREIRKGEEVLNYYGPLSNAELLRRYGYTSPKHARHDVVELSWQLIKAATSKLCDQQSICTKEVCDEIFRIYEDDNAGELEIGFVLERESGDPDDNGRHASEPKFLSLPEDLTSQLAEVLDAIFKTNTRIAQHGEARTKLLKKTTLLIMQDVLGARLLMYATSLDQDKALLRNGKLGSRQGAAVVVRSGEKVLLQEASAWVAEKLTKYSDITFNAPERNGVMKQEGPARKKQKR